MASPPTGDLPHPSVGRGPRAPPRASRIARRDTWVPPYESYCAPFGAEHHRQADAPVRPQGTAPLMSRRGDVGIAPYGRFAAPLCRAGSACPAGINAYCAAGHAGPALRIILRPLRCRASPTGGRRDGRPCPPRVTAHFPPGRCGHRPLRIHPPVMRCRGRRPRRPASAKRCHSEPVTVSLAWESVSAPLGLNRLSPSSAYSQ